MKWRTYPAYRPSGVDWVREVPVHWEVVPIRYAARLESGHTPSRQHPEYWQDCSIPWFSLADVWQVRDDNRERVYETAELISELGIANSAARLLPEGTVMLSRTASVGFSAIMGTPMATTQDFANWVCGPRIRPEYLLYVLRSMRPEYRRLMMGSTHQTIYMPDIAAFRTPLPSLDEQDLIVASIRHNSVALDTLIAKQERLIELVQEKRQAVISYAVTKGLNPNAPMKTSGVEWLGDVPAHWHVVRVGSLFRQIAEAGTEGLPVLTVSIHTGVSDREYDEDELDRKVVRSEDRSKYKRVQPGDLVYNMMRAWQGGFGSVTVAGMVSPAYVVARPYKELITKYVEQVLRTPQAIEELRLYSRGITDFRLRLYWDEFKSIQVPMPPLSEQEGIMRAVSASCGRLDALMDESRKLIELMREHRAALISAAVTGKIDVRDEAAVAASEQLVTA